MVLKSLSFVMVSIVFMGCSLNEYKIINNQHKFGIADKSNNIIFEPIYDEIDSDLSQKNVLVIKDGLYGYIDLEEKKVLKEPSLNVAFAFSKSNNAVFRDDYGNTHLMNDELKIIDSRYDYISVRESYGYRIFSKDNKYGILDSRAREMFEPVDYVVYRVINSNIVLIKDRNNRGKHNSGLMDVRGNILFEPKYEIFLNDFNNNIIISDRKSAYILDGNAKVLSTGDIQEVVLSSEHPYSFVKIDGKYAIVDQNAKLITEPRFTNVRAFNKHGVSVVSLNNKSLFIDEKANILSENIYSKILLNNDYIRVKSADEYIFLDAKNTKEVARVKADMISDFVDGCALIDSYSSKKKKLVYAFIDDKFNIKELPEDVNVESVYDNLIKFEKDNKFGVMNRCGDIVLEPKFNEFKIEFNQKASKPFIAKLDGMWFLVNSDSNIISSGYDWIYRGYGDGLYSVKKDLKEGLIYQDGTVLIEPKYEYLSALEYGLYIAKKDGKYGLINSSDEIIAEFIFDELKSYMSTNSKILAKKDSKFNYISKRGEYLYDRFYDLIEPGSRFDIIELDGKFGVISKNGALLEPIYDSIIDLDSRIYGRFEPIFIIEKELKYGLATVENGVIVEPMYDAIELLEPVRYDDEYSVNQLSSYGIKEGRELVDKSSAILMGVSTRDSDRLSDVLIVLKNSDGTARFLSKDLKYLSPIYHIDKINCKNDEDIIEQQ